MIAEKRAGAICGVFLISEMLSASPAQRLYVHGVSVAILKLRNGDMQSRSDKAYENPRGIKATRIRETHRKSNLTITLFVSIAHVFRVKV